MEPDSGQYVLQGDDKGQALVSIAISLKRIADALNSPNEYGEVGSAAMAGAIARGLRDR
jgi:hypothetical protein